MINRCGLIKPDLVEKRTDPITKKEDNRATPDSVLVKQAWQLYQRDFGKGVESRLQEPCASFRGSNCLNVKVKFLGVWDTVGALGVPMFSKTPLARAKYGFHDTSLGRVVENAYHAVAIHEQREDYQVTLWDAKHPHGTKEVEQRWFPGAHANVGGGYATICCPTRRSGGWRRWRSSMGSSSPISRSWRWGACAPGRRYPRISSSEATSTCLRFGTLTQSSSAARIEFCAVPR